MREVLAQTTDYAGALWRVCANPEHNSILLETTTFDARAQAHQERRIELPYGEESQPMPGEMANRLKLPPEQFRLYARDRTRLIVPARSAKELDRLSRQMLNDFAYVRMGELRVAVDAMRRCDAQLDRIERRMLVCAALAISLTLAGAVVRLLA